VSDGVGGAIVTWQDARSGTNYDIYAQRVNASGVVQWTANGVALCSAEGHQQPPDIASDGAGGAIITWWDNRGGSVSDIYAQRVNASGAVQWTANGAPLCTDGGSQRYAVLASDGAGGAIVAWDDNRGGSYDIYAQRISATGVTQWATDGVALCTATNNQVVPRIVADDAGGAIVTWGDFRNGTNYDIYAQRVSADGMAQLATDGVAVCAAVGEQTNHMIVLGGAGAAIVTWEDYRSGMAMVYAQRVDYAMRPFTEVATGLPGLAYSSSAWGDYDSDGDLDLLLTGYDGVAELSRIYRNDAGTFHDSGARLCAVDSSAVVWADFDNDGDLDVLVAGYGYGCSTTCLYRNDGNGVFTAVPSDLPGVSSAALACADYDNDGDLDIALSGFDWQLGMGANITRLYRNDGGLGFTEVAAGLPGVAGGSLAWGDYDDDGDPDLLMAGRTETGRITRIYRNDGGTFTDIAAGLPGVGESSVAWGDYDHDGDLDIALAGCLDAAPWHVTTIYRNDGNGVFTEISAGLPGVRWASVAWGDYDNDGDLDLLLSGCLTGPPYEITRVYRNNGDGTFTDFDAGLAGVKNGAAMWGDYDNDGRLDIFVSGSPTGLVTRLYRNAGAPVNTPPTAPSGLSAAVVGDSVTLGWNASTDAQTPAAGLSYNLRIGTTPGSNQVSAAMAIDSSGWRRVPQLGNAQQRTSRKIKLPPGVPTFYWSVQAVDGAFAGGPFAAEQNFQRTAGVADERPRELSFTLAGANPAVGDARFRFGLPSPAHVHLMLYDVTGREVARLVDEDRAPGYHTASWSANGLRAKAGIYFARFTAGGQALTRRLVLLH
jgi:hypothetical protein